MTAVESASGVKHVQNNLRAKDRSSGFGSSGTGGLIPDEDTGTNGTTTINAGGLREG